MTKEEKDKLIELSDLNREDNIKYISSEAQGIAITLDSDRFAPSMCKLERAYICGRRKSENRISELEEENAELQKRNGELAGQKASLERWLGEAKERAKDYTDDKKRQVAYECGFLDGADFGKVKANEWHYVKDELPKELHDVLCFVIHNEHRFVLQGYLRDGRWVLSPLGTYLNNDDVIAWKEIVLPKEIE